MHLSIKSIEDKLDKMYIQVKKVSDKEEQSEWSKYLCVLTAGYIEESFRLILSEYVRVRASQQIQKYLETEIKYITNCKTEKILQILNRFSPDWSAKFQNEIKNNSDIKVHIDNIVSNRHTIAHGKSSGITFLTIEKYFPTIKQGVLILSEIIK